MDETPLRATIAARGGDVDSCAVTELLHPLRGQELPQSFCTEWSKLKKSRTWRRPRVSVKLSTLPYKRVGLALSLALSLVFGKAVCQVTEVAGHADVALEPGLRIVSTNFATENGQGDRFSGSKESLHSLETAQHTRRARRWEDHICKRLALGTRVGLPAWRLCGNLDLPSQSPRVVFSLVSPQFSAQRAANDLHAHCRGT